MSYSDLILAKNPRFYYRLGETSGQTCFDSSGNGYHLGYYSLSSPVDASYTTSPSLLVNDPNPCARFYSLFFAKYSAADITGDFRNDTAGSIEAWFIVNEFGANNNEVLFFLGDDTQSYQGALSLSISSVSNTLRFDIDSGTGLRYDFRVSSAVTVGQLYHLVLVQDGSGSSIRAYLNAQLLTPTYNVADDNSLWISDISVVKGISVGGDRGWTLDFCNNSYIDEVAVYNIALSETDILQHYYTGMDYFASFLPSTTIEVLPKILASSVDSAADAEISFFSTTSLSTSSYAPLYFSPSPLGSDVALETTTISLLAGGGFTGIESRAETSSLLTNTFIPQSFIFKKEIINDSLQISIYETANTLLGIIESLKITSTITLDQIIKIIENLYILETGGSLIQQRINITDTLSLSSLIQILYRSIISENLSIEDNLSDLINRVEKVIEKIDLTALEITTANLAAIVVSTLLVKDAFVNLAAVLERLQITDLYDVLSKAVSDIVENILLTQILSQQKIGIVAVENNLQAVLHTETSAIFTQDIIDDFYFIITSEDNQTAYEAYVMNPENYAVSAYDNFNFNSACNVEGSYLFANKTGIYELGGNLDHIEGTDHYITSKLKTASIDFDTSNIKQVPKMYLGVLNDSNILLKVVVDGQETAWYEHKVDSVNLDTQMIEIGKGLKGRYFQFELQTKGNTEFELDEIELFPIQFGRKVR